MKSMSRLSKVGMAAAVVTAMAAPGVARADALAQSILDISNFTFRLGDGTAAKSGNLILPFITVQNASNTGDVSTKLNANPTLNQSTIVEPGVPFALSVCQGACGSFAPFTPILSPNPPPATFTGSTSELTGSALLAGANARTGNIVSLSPQGDGSSTGNVSLGADFTVVVAAPTRIEVDFNANAFLRSYLDATGTATSAYRWAISLTQNNVEVFKWVPFGLCTNPALCVGGFAVAANSFLGTLGGTVFADPFALTDQRSTNTSGDSFTGPKSGNFQVETGVLNIGEYKLTVRQTSETDAELRIPEPGTLGLISLALLGTGIVVRRRRHT